MWAKDLLFGFHTHQSACELSFGLLSYCSSKIAISRVKVGVTLKGWTGLRHALEFVGGSSKLRREDDGRVCGHHARAMAAVILKPEALANALAVGSAPGTPLRPASPFSHAAPSRGANPRSRRPVLGAGSQGRLGGKAGYGASWRVAHLTRLCGGAPVQGQRC